MYVCLSPDSKVHGANMGPTRVLWAPDVNFLWMFFVAMGRCQLVFGNATLQMAACEPFWIFGFQTLTLVGHYLCVWVEAYWFPSTTLSKRPPGGHISLVVVVS